jgi:hypothetical protein
MANPLWLDVRQDRAQPKVPMSGSVSILVGMSHRLHTRRAEEAVGAKMQVP